MALVKYILTPQTLYDITVANGYDHPLHQLRRDHPCVREVLGHHWLKGYEETKYVGEFQILASTTYAYAELGTIICQNLEKRFRARPPVAQALAAAQAQAKVQLNL